MVDLVIPATRKPVEGPRLESPEHLCIRSLRLPVAPRMSHRGEADLGAHPLAVVLERSTGELRAVIGDDAVRHPETAHDPPNELARRLRSDGLRFYPLGELVDGDV